MNVCFFASPKDREYSIAHPFIRGVEAHGDKGRITLTADYEGPQDDTDVAVAIGVKGWSRLLMETHLAAGKHFVQLDKGYVGGPAGPRSKYIRCSVDEFQPLSYLQSLPRPHDRLNLLGVKIQPWRKTGNEVIIAGGSLKYAAWHRMSGESGRDPATTWAARTARKLLKYTRRPLLYSPKPSWKDAVPIDGIGFVKHPVPIAAQLKTAWALVTFGSNAAVDAVIAGIPVFIVGDGIAKPMGLDDLARIETPYYPTDEQRLQWLADVSFAQWSLEELANGLGWRYLREQIVKNAKIKGISRT